MNIGIIGYSKYNGHPYSFSALINGICKTNYHYCQYKYIKKYLKNYSKQKVFSNIYVTNIWCSNIREAKKIANLAIESGAHIIKHQTHIVDDEMSSCCPVSVS